MKLEKPKLFLEAKSFLLFVLVVSVLIILRLGVLYNEYNSFINKSFYYTDVHVLNSYSKVKNNKKYIVLKLSNGDITFYTTSYRTDLLDKNYLRVKIFPNSNISFIDYLRGFYVKSTIKEQHQINSTKLELQEYISNQHTNKQIQEFYNAIFFAIPMSKELRDSVSSLGISHLVALSGFHLTILWGVVYGVLMLLYKPLQQKYFPYRYSLIDVGFVSIIILGIYLLFVGMPPSLLRSYVMVVIGWLLVIMGIELLSFTFLTVCVLLLLIIFPKLMFSISLWFSLAGVFYIFLLLKYSNHLHKYVIAFLVIPFGIFILMLPVVHFIFDVVNIFQLTSPIVSLVFVPFYPISILLHIFQMGWLFDGILSWYFNLQATSGMDLLSFYEFVVYMALSLTSIWSKRVFYVTLGVALLYVVNLFIFI